MTTFTSDATNEYRAALRGRLRMADELKLIKDPHVCAVFLLKELSDADVLDFIRAVAERSMPGGE
jgi:hypothetical protein